MASHLGTLPIPSAIPSPHAQAVAWPGCCASHVPSPPFQTPPSARPAGYSFTHLPSRSGCALFYVIESEVFNAGPGIPFYRGYASKICIKSSMHKSMRHPLRVAARNSGKPREGSGDLVLLQVATPLQQVQQGLRRGPRQEFQARLVHELQECTACTSVSSKSVCILEVDECLLIAAMHVPISRGLC